MRNELITPFIEAAVSTFDTMCKTKVTRDGALQFQYGLLPAYDFMGILGLSGSMKGAVVMSLPLEIGMAIVGRFVGETITQAGPDLMDGYGELLNIIAGAAAAKIPKEKITLALPTVMIGKEQLIYSSKDEPWIIIPMAFSDLGKFNIYVAMAEQK